jgi:hypothetical protein
VSVQVSTATPFTAGCTGTFGGANYLNGPVETYVAVDPVRPEHLVGAWQQDRWSNGGSNGQLSAVSMDRGRTWTVTNANFSTCGGGEYDRASDPWVSISPNGTAHQASLGVNGAGAATAILVSRSDDGGFTWNTPVTVHRDPVGGDDKESITADPTDSHYVYLVWDRILNGTASTWFSRSTDGGLTWETPRAIFDPGAGGTATVHQIQVLPDGSLADVFALAYGINSGKTPGSWVAVLRSQDHGTTWSAPILVADDRSVGTADVKTRQSLRTGAGIPSAAVDRASGAIYVVWSDSRFSNGQRDGIALSKSTDGGLTWSDPVQVNQAPNVQAFTPAVAVGLGGRVAVTYYDFRQDNSDPAVLLTMNWRVLSIDGGATWTETPVAGPFNILNAPRASNAPFLGDYQGIAATGSLFVAFFAAAGDSAASSNVIASSVEAAGDTRSLNSRVEVNPNPQLFHTRIKTVPRKK